MEFEWDEAKRLANLAKHGFDFIDAIEVFALLHVEEAPRLTDGEPRFLAIGPLGNQVITVVFAHRGNTIRLISARSARRGEPRRYQALLD